MGEEVTAQSYTREQRQRYREKVRQNLDVFERMLSQSRFEFDRPMTGMEIELNLVDAAYRPKFANAEVLEEIADPGYQTELAQNVAALKKAGVTPSTAVLEAVSEPITELTTALADLKKVLAGHSAENAYDEALHARDALLPAMDAVRAAADTLEGVVADDLWPLPTYQEMLYIL